MKSIKKYNENFSNYLFDFLESSKWHFSSVSDQFKIGNSEFNNHLILNAHLHEPQVSSKKKIPLKKTKLIKSQPVHLLLQSRNSTRKFDKKGVTFKEFSKLLSNSFSINFRNNQTVQFNFPSAGALFPTDIYFINQKINGLQKGIYYYNPYTLSAELVNSLTAKELNLIYRKGFLLDQRNDIELNNSSAIIIFVSSINRLSLKYGDRSLRFCLIEIGSILQNFYLISENLGIGICANGGYIDDYLSELLEIKSDSQTVLLTATIGNKKC